MSEENKAIDQGEVLVAIKGLEKDLLGKLEGYEKAAGEANEQVKAIGEVTEETKGKLDAMRKEYDEVYDRIQNLEQKGAVIAESKGYDLGAEFEKSQAFMDLKEGRTGRARMEVKTAIINATGQNQPLVPADRQGGIYTTPNRGLTIRDVLPSSATNSNLIEFTREASFTNNAGPTVAGSPEAYENVTKPESAMTFSLVNEPVVTLAHFIPASKQVMDDSASLQSHINGRLMYGLKLKEETQLLSGTGANHQLNGLITQATTYVNSSSPNYTNEIDIIRDAIRQAHVAEYRPNFLVLNPLDWMSIEIRHVGTGDDRDWETAPL